MIDQPVSVVSQCSLNALLSGWLAEISADLREAVARKRRFATMRLRYANPRTVLCSCETLGAKTRCMVEVAITELNAYIADVIYSLSKLQSLFRHCKKTVNPQIASNPVVPLELAACRLAASSR